MSRSSSRPSRDHRSAPPHRLAGTGRQQILRDPEPTLSRTTSFSTRPSTASEARSTLSAGRGPFLFCRLCRRLRQRVPMRPNTGCARRRGVPRSIRMPAHRVVVDAVPASRCLHCGTVTNTASPAEQRKSTIVPTKSQLYVTTASRTAASVAQQGSPCRIETRERKRPGVLVLVRKDVRNGRQEGGREGGGGCRGHQDQDVDLPDPIDEWQTRPRPPPASDHGDQESPAGQAVGEAADGRPSANFPLKVCSFGRILDQHPLAAAIRGGRLWQSRS